MFISYGAAAAAAAFGGSQVPVCDVRDVRDGWCSPAVAALLYFFSFLGCSRDRAGSIWLCLGGQKCGMLRRIGLFRMGSTEWY